MNGHDSDIVRVQHFLDTIAEMEKYLHGVSKEAFLANPEKRFDTIKQIEIIGEACNRISSQVKEKYPHVA